MAYRDVGKGYAKVGGAYSQQSRGLSKIGFDIESELVKAQKRLDEINQNRQLRDLFIDQLAKMLLSINNMMQPKESEKLKKELGTEEYTIGGEPIKPVVLNPPQNNIDQFLSTTKPLTGTEQSSEQDRVQIRASGIKLPTF